MLTDLAYRALATVGSVDLDSMSKSTRAIWKSCQLLALASPTTTPDQAIQNLGDLVEKIVVALGVIMALWGVVQVGMSMAQLDASQRMNGFLVLAGGILVAIAPGVLVQLGVTGGE